MATFHFDLVSPEHLLMSGEVEQVDVPGTEGDFGVLAGHAPMVTALRPGILTIKRDGGVMKIVILGGFAEVSASTVSPDAEGRIAKLDPSAALDKEIARLDHFKALDYHLQGTAMH